MLQARSTIPCMLISAHLTHSDLWLGIPLHIKGSHVRRPDGFSCAGHTSYNIRKGERVEISFQARPGVVITGGTQNLEFMNDPVSASFNCDSAIFSFWLRHHKLQSLCFRHC